MDKEARVWARPFKVDGFAAKIWIFAEAESVHGIKVSIQ
ncbi:hypothetical protein SCG7086_AN_00250 [Chlamydiales bacterium SCGC AG-110-P3]|nr:hypothetical protein SCG7086_AN_00250 [Chlamydiales bacterium SCGC AG-110-P3]